MISKVLSLKPQPWGSVAEICRDAGGGSGAAAAAAGAGLGMLEVPALGSHPQPGKGTGTEGSACGSRGSSLPGGLKLILEKGIWLVFRAFN